MSYQILFYQTSSGKILFDEWFEKLKDIKAKTLILERLDRITLGNLGDTKLVSNGVNELRLHFGPGYRLYYAKSGTKIIVLLCGGTKKAQQKDINVAIKFLLDFKTRKQSNAKN